MNDPALSGLAALVQLQTGIALGEPRLPALAAAVRRVSPEASVKDFLDRAREPVSGPALVARLVDEITIQETYFFREPRELNALDWGALLRAARERGDERVRVWVAACATGEEAYMVAILAAESFAPSPAPVTILATDISARALERAQEGVYGARSLRTLPTALRERYLARSGERDRIRDSLRGMIRLRHHNLARDPYPPPGEVAFDVIACRNVLIYFGPDVVPRVIEGLESALAPGGQLILGSADRLSASAARPSQVLDATPFRPAEPDRWPLAKAPTRREWAPAPADPEPGEAMSAADDDVELAVRIAHVTDTESAHNTAERLLARNPLDADAYFVRGLAELGAGQGGEAVASFRRALYVDPSFGLAAFKLGRAYDAAGDARAAKRAYEQALRTLDPDDDRHRSILDQVDLGDVAAACRARLGALAA